MTKITTLEDAFIHGLSDIYSAEKQLTKALPELAKASSNIELVRGFTGHLTETENQVQRIEEIASIFDITLHPMQCKAIEGLIAEGGAIIADIDPGPVRDAMLIIGAQKVEHYEIACYGSLVALAKKIGYDEAVNLLEETLKEEKATDERLNDIATSSVNDDALKVDKVA